MAYKTVVWDWNGTLLDDVTLAVDVVNEILHDHQLERLTRQRYKQIFDFPVQRYYGKAGMDFSDISFETISERYCQAFEDQIDKAPLFSDVRPVLSSIEALGVRQFILSSTEHGALVRMVSGFGITESFHDIRGNPDGLARSKIEVGGELIQTHNIEPGKALMVGDTQHDWEVAEELGMDCLLVATGHQSHERLLSAGCPVLECATDVVIHLSERH